MEVKDTCRKLIGKDLDEDLLNSLIDLESQKILEVLSPYGPYSEIPGPLSYILVELVVYRFNKIGSEGMTREGKSGGEETYDPSYENDLLEKCRDYAKRDSDIDGKRQVKFL